MGKRAEKDKVVLNAELTNLIELCQSTIKSINDVKETCKTKDTNDKESTLNASCAQILDTKTTAERGKGAGYKSNCQNVNNVCQVSNGNYFVAEITKRSSLQPKFGDDNNASMIVGISITINGSVLLADLNNNKLKAFDYNEKFIDYVVVPHGPFGIAAFDATTAVASSKDKKIHVIDISCLNSIRTLYIIKLDFDVLGLTSFNNMLVVTAMTKPRSVKMLEWNGQEVWSAMKDKQGNHLFEAPEHVTSVGNDVAKVVVSDYRKETLTVISGKDGSILQIIAVAGYGPQGLAFDKLGNLFVACYDRNEVYIFSKDFKIKKKLISSPKYSICDVFAYKPYQPSPFCKDCPFDVAFNNVTCELYVCYDMASGEIDRFQPLPKHVHAKETFPL